MGCVFRQNGVLHSARLVGSVIYAPIVNHAPYLQVDLDRPRGAGDVVLVSIVEVVAPQVQLPELGGVGLGQRSGHSDGPLGPQLVVVEVQHLPTKDQANQSKQFFSKRV